MGYLAKYKLLTLKKADAIIFIRKIPTGATGYAKFKNGPYLILKTNAEKFKKFKNKKIEEAEGMADDDDEEEKQHVSETLEKFLSTGKRLLYIQIFISSLASFGFIFYVICTYQEN